MALKDSWTEFTRTPVRMRVYLVLVGLVAVVLAVAASGPVLTPGSSTWLTAAALLAVSVINVEVGRRVTGGLVWTQQAHKALSAWAFASAMLLPTWWLLVVVPLTYAHARWRGIRVPLWKWVGSAGYLVLAGVAAAAVRQAFLGIYAHWSAGDGRTGFLVMLGAAAAFLAVEALLFWGSVAFNDPEDERWLKATLSSPAFYATEAGVLLVGGLFALVWVAGVWFSLFFVPIYVLVQHAVLLGPLQSLNATLARTNAELDQANEFKTDLMGMLGHELGNPLTSILGYAEIGAEAAERGDLEHTRSSLAVVRRNAENLAVVLSDIVHLVASDRGVLTAVPETLDLAPRLTAAAADLRPGHRPEVECDPDLAVLVQPGHLDQILANLLSNADKYGGGATSLSATGCRGGQVEVAVVDHGPGVSEDFAGELFERFRRDASTAATASGTGLGLFISRELARANGGDLVHEPAQPTGSRFVVRLPRAAAGV